MQCFGIVHIYLCLKIEGIFFKSNLFGSVVFDILNKSLFYYKSFNYLCIKIIQTKIKYV